MAKVTELRFVEHQVFGPGCVFASRVADIGDLLDVWFVTDQKVRTMLPAHVTAADSPDKLSRELRAAFAAYKKSHRQPVRRTAYLPRLQRQFRDGSFKSEMKHIVVGDDPAAADEEQDSAAD